MTNKTNKTSWSGPFAKINSRIKLESRLREKIVDDLFEKIGQLKGNETVLDLGCGPGLFSLKIAEKLNNGKVIALDLSPEMLSRLKERAIEAKVENKISYVEADAIQTGLDSESVDIVVSNMMLHELKDPNPLYEEIARVLKPGGKLYLRDVRRNIRGRIKIRLFHTKEVCGPQSEKSIYQALGDLGLKAEIFPQGTQQAVLATKL